MKHLAPGEVRPTLSIVGYPDEVAEAMAFVFSNTCIREKAMSAQALTFLRSVTLEGDAHEPSWMMSGIAAPSGSNILVCTQELRPRNALQLRGGLLQCSNVRWHGVW